MGDGGSGRVIGVAYRPARREAMREVSECVVEAGKGLVNEDRTAGNRHVTLLSRASWSAVCVELGAELDWVLRRANLLVDGVDLEAAMGKTLTIGPVRVLVHGETKPCGLMDYQYKGLRSALAPDFRGGALAEVLSGGTIRVGDAVFVA